MCPSAKWWWSSSLRRSVAGISASSFSLNNRTPFNLKGLSLWLLRRGNVGGAFRGSWTWSWNQNAWRFLTIPLPTGDPAAEEWSQWSVCSLTCGQGWQVRTRSCVSSPYGTLCSGALRETRMCNNTSSCPGEPGIVGSGTWWPEQSS